MEKSNDGSKLNIYQKLLEVQTELKVKKERENKFADFNFRSAEDILREVKPVLKKYNLLLLLQDELVQMDNAMYIKATAQIIECDSPNAKLETHAYAKECAEPKPKMDSSQTTGCCSSYARKYALNALFCLDDASQDPDSMDNAKTTKKTEVKKVEISNDNPDFDIHAELETITQSGDVIRFRKQYIDKVKDKQAFINAINAKLSGGR